MAQHTTAFRQVTYRLLPRRRGNWRLLERTLEAQRVLYNAALEERIDCHRKTGRTSSYFDPCTGLTERHKALPAMAAVSVKLQRGTLKRLDEAYKGFFRRARAGGAGFPRFKGRRHWNSIAVAEGVKVAGGRLRVPGFGWLAIRRRGGNPYPDGEARSAVLKREGGKWYAVICFAVSVPVPEDDGTIVGLDMNPGGARLEARKRRHQRRLARQKRGSRRRERTRRRLARTQRRLAMRRRNWQHHASRRIAGRAHTVVIEDLNTRGMTRAAKGTAEAPGRNVRAKAALNRAVLGTGWSALRRMLEYKAGAVIAVDPAYTSRACAACGVIDAGSRKTRDNFECVACGHAAHADLNAAANIRRRGLAHLHGEGRSVQPTPATREIDRRVAL